MPWKKVNPAGGQKLVSFSSSYPSLASAALSGVPLLAWPFDFPGRMLAISLGADTITGTPGARFRKTDASAASTAEIVSADKVFAADAYTLVDADDTDTVEAQENFDVGDILLMDKNALGDLVRANVHVLFATG